MECGILISVNTNEVTAQIVADIISAISEMLQFFFLYFTIMTFICHFTKIQSLKFIIIFNTLYC